MDYKNNIWIQPEVKSNVKVYISGDLLIGDVLLNKILKMDNDENQELQKLILEGNLTENLQNLSEKSLDKIITTKNLFPAARSRHTCVCIKNLMYLFGGGSSELFEDKIYDDFWIFNTESLEWDKLKVSGEEKPISRWGHSMNYIEKEEKIYLFGGCGYGKKMLNDLFEFDLKLSTWKKIELSTKYGSVAPRAAHTLTFYEGYFLILWGGDNTRFFSELLILSLEKNDFIKRIKFKFPKPRCAHTSNLIGNQIYVFGGVGSDEELGSEFQEMYILDIDTAIKKASSNYQMNSKEEKIPVKEEGFSSSILEKTRIRSSSKDVKYSREQQIFSDKDAKEMTNWLVSLGLGGYTSLFLSEEIDLQCVSLLTEADLIRIGVAKYGPRKKILAAAEELYKSRIPDPPPAPPVISTVNFSYSKNSNSQNQSNSNQQLIESIQKLTNYIEDFKEAVNDLTVTLTIMSSNNRSNQNTPRQGSSSNQVINLQNDEQIQTPSYKYQIHPKPEKKSNKNLSKRNSKSNLQSSDQKYKFEDQKKEKLEEKPVEDEKKEEIKKEKISKTSLLDAIIFPKKSWFEQMEEDEKE
jgi:N-acetylneuraminic acid mutarotase